MPAGPPKQSTRPLSEVLLGMMSYKIWATTVAMFFFFLTVHLDRLDAVELRLEELRVEHSPSLGALWARLKGGEIERGRVRELAAGALYQDFQQVSASREILGGEGVRADL